MKHAALACAVLVASFALPAYAEEPPAHKAATAGNEERVVAKARELLDRARFLDEAAVGDEKTAADLVARLPNLKIAAKAARDRASRAKEGDGDRETLLAKAEDLEVDVAVSEAEVSVKKRAAAEDRRIARDLRARAIRILKDGTLDDPPSAATSCDPPFRYTSDGRKIYRIECLR